jgi:hypothetical protein
MRVQSGFYNSLVTLKEKASTYVAKFVPDLSWGRKIINSIVLNKLDVRPVHRQSQDIQKWRTALLVAESQGQYRSQLYDIYDEVLLDGFIYRLLGKRRESITNKALTFQKDGKVVDDIVALTQKTFFADFLSHAIDSRFWGHSLIEMMWKRDGTGETILIPRKHVKPRYKIVTPNQWDTAGYKYDEPPFSNTVIAVGDCEDLGVMLRVCPLGIWKRADMGDWTEFVEVFGMPTVFAKYNNEQSRDILIQALDNMGSRGRAVMPNDAVIEYHEAASSSNSGDVFNALRSALNEEISITVLGNTMTTTEAKSSGYAQSKTHERSQNEIHKDDCSFVIRLLNEQLTPYLQKLGFDTEGGVWQFVEEETLTLPERLDMDLKIATKVKIDPDYWYEKYKLPKPANGDTEPEGEGEDDREGDNKNDPKSKKKR